MHQRVAARFTLVNPSASNFSLSPPSPLLPRPNISTIIFRETGISLIAFTINLFSVRLIAALRSDVLSSTRIRQLIEAQVANKFVRSFLLPRACRVIARACDGGKTRFQSAMEKLGIAELNLIDFRLRSV